jgi:predicted amidohydrolase
VAEVLVQPIRALRTRVRETYCAQLLRKVTAILEACRGWGVQLVVFPEYSIPWQILDGVAATGGEMVVVAGTHSVTRAARTDGVYRRLGGVPPPALEAVAPVLHHGKLLALTSKMHAARPERGALRESERWSTIALPPDLGLPSPLGVVICLDFLVAPGAEPDKVTRDKLQQARLLAVPSWTPTHTLREFEAAAWVSAARGRTPVLYANVTAHGGSTIYVDKEHGHEAGRFPQQIGRLDAGDEGVVVVDVDLSDQRRGTLTQFLDRQIATPIAQASLVYRSHPAGAAYAAWLEAQAPALANGDDGLDDVIAAIQADAAILRSAGALPGAAARRLRLRSLLNYSEGLNHIEDVACRVREVVLPADVVTHHFVRAAMARGAGQAIDDLLLHGELRGQQRELVAIRDRLQVGGEAASQRTEAEWTEAARDALAAITAAVRGEVPVAPAPAPAVRIETRPLPTEIEPVALADRTVKIDGQAHELVFRARASEVVAALYQPLHRDGEGARDLGRVRSGSSDVLAVDRLVVLLRAEGGTHLAVVGLGPDEVERAALLHPNAHSAWAELAQQVPSGKPYEIAPLVPLAVVARVGGVCQLYRIALGDARKELGIRPWQPREAAGLEATLDELGLGESRWIDVSPEEIATRIAGLRPVLDGARDVIIGLRDRRLREVGGHYVDPDVEVDDRSGPARAALDDWLDPEAPPHDKADRPIALVLGEFGAGKSTLLADWCLHRWRDRSDSPRPILIDLAGAGEQADALALVLGGCGLADTPAHRAAMALLIAAGHAVPCFDGFDEMATRLQASALGGRLAALMTYYGFVCLFPLLLVLVSVLGFVLLAVLVFLGLSSWSRRPAVAESSAQPIASVTMASSVSPHQWDVQANQKSGPVSLIGGHQYYLEVLMKAGISDGFPVDHLAVRWQLPDGTVEEPIPIARLSPYGLMPPLIVAQPADTTVADVRGNHTTTAYTPAAGGPARCRAAVHRAVRLGQVDGGPGRRRGAAGDDGPYGDLARRRRRAPAPVEGARLLQGRP